jgi:hypothetical protein
MRLKIYNGTPLGSEGSLCNSCRLATIIRGRTLDEEIVQCHASAMRTVRVTFKVTSCSEYHDERMPSYFELVEQAWILQPGSKKRPAAFVRKEDLPDEDVMNLLANYRSRRDP